MTTTGRRRDVAWGLFYTTFTGKRCLWSSPSRADVVKAYKDLHPGSANAPTKPFRIVPPRTQIRAGRGGKRGRK